LLALPSDRTQRRHVERHAAVLDRALAVRGHAVRAWLRGPRGPLAGLWFVSGTNAAGPGQGAAGPGPRVDSARRRAALPGQLRCPPVPTGSCRQAGRRSGRLPDDPRAGVPQAAARPPTRRAPPRRPGP
jgi:hypothetical protein